jgi:hypothetical protein
MKSVDPPGKTWEDCADKLIDDCTDFELAKYLIRTSSWLKLSETYWLSEKGGWTVECTDAEPHRVNNDICSECTHVTGPQHPKNNECVVIWMSPHKGRDFSMRRAICENYPKAKTQREIRRAHAHWVRVFGKGDATDAAPQSLENPVRNQIVSNALHAFLELSMV